MNATVRRTTSGLLLLAAFALAGVRAQLLPQDDFDEISLSGRTPESIILTWPSYSYRLARQMIAKYGQPAEAADNSLVWRDNGPWKSTIVYRVAPGNRALRRNRGRLEQSVAYRVPAGGLAALARFDRDIEANVKEGRLTVRTDEENENFLVLNLADEVLQGRRTPQEAYDFRRNAARLRDSGKSSPYYDRLMFAPGEQPANPRRPD